MAKTAMTSIVRVGSGTTYIRIPPVLLNDSLYPFKDIAIVNISIHGNQLIVDAATREEVAEMSEEN